VPTGCYEMRGHFDPGSGRVVLSGHRWILRPPHYVMVGLSGQLSEAGDRIAGRVSGPSCTSFEVERAPAHADPEASGAAGRCSPSADAGRDSGYGHGRRVRRPAS